MACTIPRRLRAPLVAFVASVVGAACGLEVGPVNTTTGSSNTTTVAQFCASVCTARTRCDASVTLSGCESDCATQRGAALPHLRSDWTANFLTCASAAACSAWSSGSATGDCTAQADRSISASTTAQNYCAQALAKDNECGAAGSETQASCEEIVKSVDDASLGAAAACLSRDCSGYVACVKSATGATN